MFWRISLKMRKEKSDKITKYWIEHSDYDLKTAEAMYKSRRYLYVTFIASWRMITCKKQRGFLNG